MGAERLLWENSISPQNYVVRIAQGQTFKYDRLAQYAREAPLAYGWDGEIWLDNQKRKDQRAL